MSEYMRASRCPKCRGSLAYETIGSYGDMYPVCIKTGQPGKRRLKRCHYNKEYSMVYCLSCGTNYEHAWVDDAIYILFEGDDNETD